MNETIAQRGVPDGGEAHARALVITVPMPDTLLTINARRRLHWRTQAAIAKQQRHDAMLAAYAAMSGDAAALLAPVFPSYVRVRVDVDLYRRRNQKTTDETAVVEAIKPLLDGAEDAQVFVDDRQCTIGTIRWHAWAAKPRIEITLKEVRDGG